MKLGLISINDLGLSFGLLCEKNTTIEDEYLAARLTELSKR